MMMHHQRKKTEAKRRKYHMTERRYIDRRKRRHKQCPNVLEAIKNARHRGFCDATWKKTHIYILRKRSYESERLPRVSVVFCRIA